jgi:hypothetical protein
MKSNSVYSRNRKKADQDWEFIEHRDIKQNDDESRGTETTYLSVDDNSKEARGHSTIFFSILLKKTQLFVKRRQGQTVLDQFKFGVALISSHGFSSVKSMFVSMLLAQLYYS